MDAAGDFVVAYTTFDAGLDATRIVPDFYYGDGSYRSQYMLENALVEQYNSPVVAMDDNGNGAVAWAGYTPGQASLFNVFASKFLWSSGITIDEGQIANQTFDGNQFGAAISMDVDGNYVVAWQSDGQDGDGYAIVARRFDRFDGFPEGDEFIVNENTVSWQHNAAVSLQANGDFVITWIDELQDGNGMGVYARRFANDGAALGNEFRVPTYVTGDQSSPAVAECRGRFRYHLALRRNRRPHRRRLLPASVPTRRRPRRRSIPQAWLKTDRSARPSARSATDPDNAEGSPSLWSAARRRRQRPVRRRRRQLRTAAVFDFETRTSYSVRVRVTDSGGLFFEQPFTINVLDANEAPTANDATFSLPENSAAGALVGAVTASDPDVGQSLGYAITAGNTGGAFAINGAGQITVANPTALNFETTLVFTLTVTESDNGNPVLSDTATVTINLSNVNEAPIANDATFSVPENSAAGTLVGMVPASDPDAGTTLSYAITAGNTSGAFAINAAGQITVANPAALDFETTPTFNLTVTVSDNGAPVLSDTATITVNLTDVLEPFASTV